MNAAHLTTNHKVAYELLEVRTGEYGLKPLYRSGKAPLATVDAVRREAHEVLTSAFGEDGSHKRKNVTALRAATLSSWEKDGTSARNLQTFLDTVVRTAGAQSE